MPISTALALTAVSLRLTPYRSIGSDSPRIADASASTASLVEPPNCAARSAPIVDEVVGLLGEVLDALVLEPGAEDGGQFQVGGLGQAERLRGVLGVARG